MRRALAGALLLAAAVALPSARADEEKPAAPAIRVEPDGFDFGKALPEKTLRKEFVLRNFGDAELVIEDVKTTCGCTAAITAESRVPPGGSTRLLVSLETRGYKGKLERQVLVRSNDPKTPLLTVKVGATVEAPPAPKPRR
jgi:hypothetical protein